MKRWYDMKALGGQRAALFIYGDVVSDRWLDEEVSAASFLNDLEALGDIAELDLHINSPGGNVFAGIAIYTALRSHPATITAHVDGVAASIAGVIMCGADRVLISDAGLIMVHNPWGIAVGDADDLRKQADMQDKAKSAIINAYQNRVAMNDDELSAAMDAETWYTADEAVALGWADDIIPAAKMVASMDLSRFKNAPKGDQPAADQAATLPATGDHTMTQAANESATSSGQDINVTEIEAAARKRALEDDRKRRSDIGALFAKFPQHDDLCSELQNDLDIDVDAASRRLIAKLGEAIEPAGHNVSIQAGETDQEKFIKAAEALIAIKARIQDDDAQNPYRGYTLLRLAEACLERSGVDTRGMSKMDIAGRAFTLRAATHSTSDFPLILANNANKAMLLGYSEAPETFSVWTRAVTLSDFKTQDMVGLSEFSDLELVYENGEFKHGTFGERREQMTLLTYGKMFSISRQAIINDDLNAFTVIPRKMGRAAARQVGDLAYAVLTGNPNMADGNALFDATHSNVPGAGAAPTSATLDAGRTAMATQTDSSGNANLNLMAAYSLVPYALLATMSQVIESETEIAASQNNSRRPNTVRQMVRQVIADARLDTASTTAWYLAADPMVTDTVAIGYLDGNPNPMLEQQDGWTVDGTEYKVRIDAVAKALDWRAMYRGNT